jgi:hypothetical protein
LEVSGRVCKFCTEDNTSCALPPVAMQAGDVHYIYVGRKVRVQAYTTLGDRELLRVQGSSSGVTAEGLKHLTSLIQPRPTNKCAWCCACTLRHAAQGNDCAVAAGWEQQAASGRARSSILHANESPSVINWLEARMHQLMPSQQQGGVGLHRAEGAGGVHPYTWSSGSPTTYAPQLPGTLWLLGAVLLRTPLVGAALEQVG